MASQKKWMFKEKDAQAKYQEWQNYVFGKHNDYEAVEKHEFTAHEEMEVTRAAGKGFALFQLAVRMLVGHTMQLWIQSGFLMYGFEQSGPMARHKVMFSMMMSLIMVIARTVRSSSSIGELGLFGYAII